MQPGDYTDEGSEPWANRRWAIPKRTYTGRVVYARSPSHRRGFKMRDVERILDSIVPPDDEPMTWAQQVVASLRVATIAMLDKILFFLPSSAVNSIYEWSIQLLDRMFNVETYDDGRKTMAARLLISHIAARAGLTVTITKP